MVKNILAFFGLLFLTLVILVGVGVLGYVYDIVGIISIPKAILQEMLPDESVMPRAVTLSVLDSPMHSAQWSNPLDLLPLAEATTMPTITPMPTVTPFPTATATPIPPLDPVVYRADTLVRLKEFVGALERWLAVNDQAAADQSLLDDSLWQDEMTAALEAVVERSESLAEIGPPPAEYAAMDQLFNRIQDESENMQWFVNQGIAKRDPRALTGAGESFERIKGYLTQAVTEMVAAGWALE